MKVKINEEGKIIAFNTKECDIDLPENMLGDDWNKWIYDFNNLEFILDVNYKEPVKNENKSFPYIL